MYPPFIIVPTINVTIAIPTPDNTNPDIAGTKCFPALNPSSAEKIKFPAPKKIPKSNSPIKKPFFIILSLL